MIVLLKIVGTMLGLALIGCGLVVDFHTFKEKLKRILPAPDNWSPPDGCLTSVGLYTPGTLALFGGGLLSAPLVNGLRWILVLSLVTVHFLTPTYLWITRKRDRNI